jgi:hypothetical protein
MAHDGVGGNNDGRTAAVGSHRALKRPRTALSAPNATTKLPTATSLINAAFIKVLGHPDPSKRVDRFKNAYPEFWSRGVAQAQCGKVTSSHVRPGFESEFMRLAEELARGGY